MSELNQAIAELLGWKAEERLFSNSQGGYSRWALIQPDGQWYPGVTAERLKPMRITESEIWEDLFPHDYEHSLDAVESEVPGDYSLEIWTTGDDKPAGMVRRGSQCFYGRNASTRKQAAAKALLEYLKWKSQQKGSGE